MKIAVGNSRMDKKWKNREISWEELCQKVSVTIRTTETVEENTDVTTKEEDEISTHVLTKEEKEKLAKLTAETDIKDNAV